MAVFWVVVSCSLIDVYQHFTSPRCLHHQGSHLVDGTTIQKTAIESKILLHNVTELWSKYNDEELRKL